jgi:CHAT domain-containing protein
MFNDKDSYIEKLLFNTTFIIDTLINHLKNQYPKFKSDHCLFSYFSISEIQELIADTVGILEYFYNDSVLIIFAINKKSYDIHYACPDKNFKHGIIELTKSIKFSNSQLFIEKGQLLFNELIKPIYPIIENLKSLIIIPDRHLKNIPFEVLNNPQNAFSCNIQQQDYLIKNFDISYQYSLNLLGDKLLEKKMTKENAWTFEFSGHAPFAYSSSQNISANLKKLTLPASEREITSISKLFSQKEDSSISYLGEYSTKESIESSLKFSKIVHIATHGYTDCSPDNYSILLQPIIPVQGYEFNIPSVLLDSINSGGFLTLSEIYNLDINSDLISLSTCCSGVGEGYVGEGTKSLALGFYYSGANNILYTNWNISDMHTYYFMKTFYKYVCQGISYSRSLRRAKLDIIQSNNQLPIFWSGYLLNGQL